MADDFDDQDFDFDDIDQTDEDLDEEPAEESSNRTFWIAVSVLGVVILLTLICLVAFFFLNRDNLGGGNRAALQTEAAIAIAQQTAQAIAVAETQAAAAWTATPTVTPIPTDTPTPTEVVAQATNTPSEGTPNPITQTVEALLTQAAQSTPINTSTALPTALPNTGFADDIASGGFVGLIGLAILAIVLIVFARRLRAASG